MNTAHVKVGSCYQLDDSIVRVLGKRRRKGNLVLDVADTRTLRRRTISAKLLSRIDAKFSEADSEAICEADQRTEAQSGSVADPAPEENAASSPACW